MPITVIIHPRPDRIPGILSSPSKHPKI